MNILSLKQDNVDYLLNLPKLPSEYQEVEWIGNGANSDGSYINTGIKPYGGKVEMKGVSANTGSGRRYWFGVSEQSSIKRFMAQSDSINGMNFFYSNSDGVNYSQIQMSSVTSNISEYLFECCMNSSNTVYEENVTYGYHSTNSNSGLYQFSTNLALMARNYNGAIQAGAAVKIYYFRYYDIEENLVFDGIPCYRKSDNVIGLYDAVGGEFLTNAGTGSFTVGPDIVSSGPDIKFLGDTNKSNTNFYRY